jgi:5-hydroxyisourate hydrolase
MPVSGERMSAITTHVLDVSSGSPARGVPITLERQTPVLLWEVIGKGATDGDGRLRDLLAPDTSLLPGDYRLTFDTKTYFAQQHIEGFYPQVVVAFTVRNAAQHYHVPLLLSPFGYSTYRGS